MAQSLACLSADQGAKKRRVVLFGLLNFRLALYAAKPTGYPERIFVIADLVDEFEFECVFAKDNPAVGNLSDLRLGQIPGP